MRALDTNVLVRLLVNDDRQQAQRVRDVLEGAQRRDERFLVATPVLLELVWVLSAVYDLSRTDILDAVGALAEMPILEFEHRDVVQAFIRLGRADKVDLPDLLIGLAGRSAGATTTLTFDRALVRTGLFERI